MFTTINQPNTQSTVKVQIPSMPNLLLRLEGLTIFVAAIVAYAHQGGSAWLFLALLFVPDVSMIGYLRNVRMGSYLYNAGHTYVTPILIIGAALYLNLPTVLLLGLILLAHNGMDRIMGYGLKYATTFKDTHMQHV